MITLHSVPFITTTSNILLTDMSLLRKDVPKVMFAGYLYMFVNFGGQFYYGQPLYDFNDWVSNPLKTLCFCVIAITTCSVLYYGFTYLVD